MTISAEERAKALVPELFGEAAGTRELRLRIATAIREAEAHARLSEIMNSQPIYRDGWRMGCAASFSAAKERLGDGNESVRVLDEVITALIAKEQEEHEASLARFAEEMSAPKSTKET
jgi:hypothetical protein